LENTEMPIETEQIQVYQWDSDLELDSLGDSEDDEIVDDVSEDEDDDEDDQRILMLQREHMQLLEQSIFEYDMCFRDHARERIEFISFAYVNR
jgi:hypothetical protein